MSPHRTISRSRSITIALIAAGTLAGAAVTAATWTPGSAGSPAGRTPHAREANAGQLSAAGQSSSDSRAWQTYRLRDMAAQLTAAHWVAARTQAARQAQAMASATQTDRVAGAPVTWGSPQQIAEAMLASFGWPSGQYGCLDPLWAHESGWSVTADNDGTGAYGIPQALPGSRMSSAGPDWQANAQTQIKWGLEYIKDTYGSPCGAWDHEEATGWY